MKQTRIKEIQLRIKAIENEKKKLIEELISIQSDNKDLPSIKGSISFEKVPDTPPEKIELFLKLFRCREDVYPKLWENPKKGIKGYSPACNNEWKEEICRKAMGVKCTDCENKNFTIFDNETAQLHLQGKITAGTYTITPEDKCKFLAADFDKDNWKEDIVAYKNAAREYGIDVTIERSRSGNGGHAWIFFKDFISARTARQLGAIIISNTLSKRHSISLESYDRFFPSQDYMTKGGFGNLIALPLQKVPRDFGNHETNGGAEKHDAFHPNVQNSRTLSDELAKRGNRENRRSVQASCKKLPHFISPSPFFSTRSCIERRTEMRPG